MRVVFTLLITASVGALLYLDDPTWAVAAGDLLSRANERVFATKEVRMEGLRTLSRTEIERVLPLERSIPWWMTNSRVVEARIQEHPKVKGAVVEPCPGGWFSEWGCFVISVTERVPRYIGSVDEKEWLISSDGAFMSPVEVQSEGDLQHPGVIRLDGLASQSNSPDLLKHQLTVARSSTERLEHSVGRGIERISFEGRSDLLVWFHGFEFPVVFGVTGDSPVPLEEQATRLHALLDQLGHRVSEVARIDLAFSKVGSISLKEPQLAASTEKSPLEARARPRIPAN